MKKYYFLILLLLLYTYIVASASLLWHNPILLAINYAALSLILLYIWRSKESFTFFIIAFLLGPTGEYFAINSGAWVYADSFFLIPIWIPFAWGLTSLFIFKITTHLKMKYYSYTETFQSESVANKNNKDIQDNNKTNSSHSDSYSAMLLNTLNSKKEEGQQLLAQYLRALTVFVAVCGAILKFALDNQSTPELRIGLAILGFSISTLGLLACILGETCTEDNF